MKWLDSWIFSAYSARETDLAVYRLIYAACAILTSFPCALWIARTPQAFFNPPPSLAAFFHEFPPATCLIVLNVLFGLCLGALFVGWKTPLASLGTAALFLILKSWEYSVGKINHDILWVVVPLVMCTSGWGNALSVDSRGRRSSTGDSPKDLWQLSMLALLIGGSMFTAGWEKLSTGWLDHTTHSTYGYIINNKFILGREPIGATLAAQIHSTLFWEAVDWFTVLWEVGLLFSILHRQVFFVFLAIGCLFHVGVWILLDITFPANVVAYGAFVSYASSPAVVRLRQLFSSILKSVHRTQMLVWGPAILVIGTAYIVFDVLTSPARKQFFGVAVVVLGGVIGGGYLTGLIFRSVSYRFPSPISRAAG